MSRPPKKKAPKGQTDHPGGAGGLPTKAQIMAFIAQSPGKVGKREIAQAFGIKGGDKIGLKRMLGEMGEEGALAGNRRELHAPGSLPPVTQLDITGRDAGGDLIGEIGRAHV